MLRNINQTALAVFVVALAYAQPAQASTAFEGMVRVIDGDTIDVGDRRVRLHGIDAPEQDQPCTTRTGQNWGCGDWVTRQVRDAYQGQIAQCRQVDTDKYGRTVARCFVAGQDVARNLVRAGLAFAYRKYALDYARDETNAARTRIGIHGFDIQAPARYRLTRIKGRVAPNQNCVIKGNINARGDRIYHVPGQAYYERTGIRMERGERWFCSHAQARASGWRASRR